MQYTVGQNLWVMFNIYSYLGFLNHFSFLSRKNEGK